MLRENIFRVYISVEVHVSQIYNHFSKLDNKKSESVNKKWAKDLERYF